MNLPPRKINNESLNPPDRNPIQANVSEQGRQSALGKEKPASPVGTRLLIELHHYRKGSNWDADNAGNAKSVLDGLVDAKYIEADSIKEVQTVSQVGHECETEEEECTVVEIYRVERIDPLVEPERSRLNIVRNVLQSLEIC